MLDVLALMAPFFGLVALGWIAARRGLLPVDGIGGLMTFVLYFALSALLLRLSAQGRLQAGASATLLLVYAAACLMVMALGLWWARRAGLSRRNGALAALVTAFPNTGFLGLPLLTSLLCLPTGFESPFKAEVVFVATRLFTDVRWGTRQPLLIRDPELGPIRLRGFGSCSLRVTDPSWLVGEVNGAGGCYSVASLRDPLRQLIVSRLAELLGRSAIPVFDLAGRYGQLAGDLRLALFEDLLPYGLEMPSLLIEGLSLPAEVEAALDRRNSRLVETGPLSPPPAAPVPGPASLPPPLPPPLPPLAEETR